MTRLKPVRPQAPRARWRRRPAARVWVWVPVCGLVCGLAVLSLEGQGRPQTRPLPLETAGRWSWGGTPAAGGLYVRVGLATDLPSLSLPCCQRGRVVDLGERSWIFEGALEVEPDAGATQRGVYRLQVAALKDEGQARRLALTLESRTGEPAAVRFDAGTGLYRVRVGRFADRAAAEAAAGTYALHGVTEAWVVSEGSAVGDPALRVTLGEKTQRVPGRWVALSLRQGDGVEVQRRRFRGRLFAYLNDRGSLNLINEIPLEDYLRSVVPSEMGPELYGEMEALKAQAVAARSYTLRHLGEFAEEGYDICATPRCQVYRGMEAEHPVSDQAVAVTEGQVLLYGGDLADARYSASCGGHTEDVQVVFPLEAPRPYLSGVPCVEGGSEEIAGGLPTGTPFPHGLTRRLLPLPGRVDALGALEARLLYLGRLAGLPLPEDRLASLERWEIRRFVISLFDLALDPRLLAHSTRLAELLRDPPQEWTHADLRQARSLAATRLFEPSSGEPLSDEERETLLLHLATALGVLEQRSAYFVASAEGALTVRERAEQLDYPVSSQVATFRRRGEGWTAAPLSLVPGDRLTLWRQGDRLVAVVQEDEPGVVPRVGASRRSPWTQFRSDSQLARLVAVRYPGLGFRGFQVLSRGVSGRVGRLRVLGLEDRSVEVEGLAVRWTLDLPDTNFQVRRVNPAAGEGGWYFDGSGWGHGVGLCQVGSFALAGRGLSYREILGHYYRGAQLARVRGRRRPWGPERPLLDPPEAERAAGLGVEFATSPLLEAEVGRGEVPGDPPEGEEREP